MTRGQCVVLWLAVIVGLFVTISAFAHSERCTRRSGCTRSYTSSLASLAFTAGAAYLALRKSA